jgi:hypothetical protein
MDIQAAFGSAPWGSFTRVVEYFDVCSLAQNIKIIANPLNRILKIKALQTSCVQ